MHYLSGHWYLFGGGIGVTNWFICMRFEVDIHSRLDGYWDSFPIQNSVSPLVKITTILYNNLKLKTLYIVWLNYINYNVNI